MLARKTYNKYDVFIFLLIASLVAGNLFGAFQLPRVLAILMLPTCLSCYPKIYPMIAGMVSFAFLFLLYSLFSCLWSPANLEESLLATGYNAVHMLLFFEIIVFSKLAKDALTAIFLGFFAAFVISALIAFWELITDKHLHTSKDQESRIRNNGYENYVRFFAAVTFYNFNMYSTFLCFVFPFIFYGVTNISYKSSWRIISIIASIVAIILILYNSSRGGFLALVLMGFIYIMSSLASKKFFTFLYMLAGILLLFFLYNNNSAIFYNLTMRFATQGAIEEESRFAIWENALKVATDYLYIGCGAGGLDEAMAQYASTGITMPHNVFLEILTQYGILFLGGFLWFLYRSFLKAKHIGNKYRKICVYQILFALPIVGIINSNYLGAPILWAAMAALYVFANYERIKPIN